MKRFLQNCLFWMVLISSVILMGRLAPVVPTPFVIAMAILVFSVWHNVLIFRVLMNLWDLREKRKEKKVQSKNARAFDDLQEDQYIEPPAFLGDIDHERSLPAA